MLIGFTVSAVRPPSAPSSGIELHIGTSKEKIPSQQSCWDRTYKHSCGATRLDAVTSAHFYAYHHMPDFDYGDPRSVSHTRKGCPFFSVRPQKSIHLSVLRRAPTAHGSLYEKGETLLTLLQRFIRVKHKYRILSRDKKALYACCVNQPVTMRMTSLNITTAIRPSSKIMPAP